MATVAIVTMTATVSLSYSQTTRFHKTGLIVYVQDDEDL